MPCHGLKHCRNMRSNYGTNGKCLKGFIATQNFPYALNLSAPYFGQDLSVAYCILNITHPFAQAWMFLWYKPTLVVRFLIIYMFGGKQLSLGSKCLWSKANNWLVNLFETPCIVHVFINNNVDASMVDQAPRYSGWHDSCKTLISFEMSSTISTALLLLTLDPLSNSMIHFTISFNNFYMCMHALGISNNSSVIS